MIAAARGYGVSMGDLLMVAEDVAQGRLSLPWPTAVASGENYYLVWPKPARAASVCAGWRSFCRAKCRPWCCLSSSVSIESLQRERAIVCVIPLHFAQVLPGAPK